LFEELGVQAELARKVMTAIDTRFAERPSHAPAAPSAKLPLHLILFAGHRVDLPGRQQGRFPADREPLARSMFHDAVSELLSETYQAVALASAAPGADILAHEVCGELGVRSTICLPMPPDAFARLAFADLDDWRSRFLDLQKSRDVVVLANSESLPNWLHDSGKDSWERGNEWVMNMALSWGAERITLVALWDGNRTGDARGGTAHMITLAEKAGRVHIRRLDATTLVTVQRREESPTSDRQPVVEH
jgi:hypothetical protein